MSWCFYCNSHKISFCMVHCASYWVVLFLHVMTLLTSSYNSILKKSMVPIKTLLPFLCFHKNQNKTLKTKRRYLIRNLVEDMPLNVYNYEPSQIWSIKFEANNSNLSLLPISEVLVDVSQGIQTLAAMVPKVGSYLRSPFWSYLIS